LRAVALHPQRDALAPSLVRTLPDLRLLVPAARSRPSGIPEEDGEERQKGKKKASKAMTPASSAIAPGAVLPCSERAEVVALASLGLAAALIPEVCR